MNSAQHTLKSVLQFLFYIPYFFYWWYVVRTIFWVKFIWRTFLLIADGFSIGPMLRYLFAPYHDDRTWIGRLMGFILRTIWLAVGITMTAISLGLLLFILPMHLILPFSLYFGLTYASYFDLGIKQSLVIASGYFCSFLSILIYYFYYIYQPKKTISQVKLNAEGKFDFFELEKTFMPRLRRNWHQAFKISAQDDDLEDLSYYLFLAMVQDNRNRSIFYRLNLNPKIVYKKAREKEFDLKMSFIPLSELFKKMIEEAQKLEHQHLDSDCLLVTLVAENEAIHDFLIELGVTEEQMKMTSEWIYNQMKKRDAWKYWRKAHFHAYGGYDRAWTAAWIPTLKKFSVDVTALVSQGRVPRLIGRKKEIDQIMQVLTRTTKNNVILLGPVGVGKTAIVYGIAQQMISGDLGELKNKKLVALDFSALIAGTGARGDFEERLKKVLNESGPGKTIVFIDEIASTLNVGGEIGAINAAAVLDPYISSGVIQCIGATNFKDYHEIIEQNQVFASFFQTVEIKEPNDEETMKILESFCGEIEAKQKVTITFQAISAAVKLSRQYIHDLVLPEKAIDVLDEAAVKVRRSRKKKIVTEKEVADIISAKTGVPIAKVSEAEKEKLLNLEEVLETRIIGQAEAVKMIANAMRRARTGLKDPKKPVARFLFLGPTGVGKTETCKVLAETYYGVEESMVRLDMSEYQEAGSLARLIGAPPGTSDFGVGGQLTEAVRRKPFSLIMLDELEKAHMKILDLFLQVLDDGRLTDSSGRVVSFQDSIIIATSNAQSVLIQEAVKNGVSKEQLKSLVMNNLTQNFRPEFINRFDSVVVFEPLDLEAVLQIAVLMLQEIKERLRAQEIGFEITPEALLQVARLGYNPEFGARPLRRVIQDKIEDKIAKDILEGKVKAGGVVRVSGI